MMRICIALFYTVIVLVTCHEVSAQVCKPATERTAEVGCWIVANEPLGQFSASPVFWHLDVFPTLSAAEAARASGSAVVQSLGKTWLLTVGDANWRPAGGERIAEIGPLPISPGDRYSAQYLEAIFTPGMTSSVHRHAGPEAWYTLAGETCLETPDGKFVGRAGGPPVIVPGGQPMHLTATGTELRRALAGCGNSPSSCDKGHLVPVVEADFAG